MNAMERASKAWGDAMPGWVRLLAEECDRTSQNSVAKRIDYTGSVVTQVLGRSYAGSLVKVQKAVEGALGGRMVECPALGEIPSDRCLWWQKKPLSGANPGNVQMYKACRSGCPHSHLAREEFGQQRVAEMWPEHVR